MPFFMPKKEREKAFAFPYAKQVKQQNLGKNDYF